MELGILPRLPATPLNRYRQLLILKDFVTGYLRLLSAFGLRLLERLAILAITCESTVSLVLQAFTIGAHGDILVLNMGEPIRTRIRYLRSGLFTIASRRKVDPLFGGDRASWTLPLLRPSTRRTNFLMTQPALPTSATDDECHNSPFKRTDHKCLIEGKTEFLRPTPRTLVRNMHQHGP